jgi:hypothetical protein
MDRAAIKRMIKALQAEYKHIKETKVSPRLKNSLEFMKNIRSRTHGLSEANLSPNDRARLEKAREVYKYGLKLKLYQDAYNKLLALYRGMGAGQVVSVARIKRMIKADEIWD